MKVKKIVTIYFPTELYELGEICPSEYFFPT